MRLLLFFKCSTLGLFNARFSQSSITCSLRSATSQTHHQLRSLLTKLDSCFRQLLPLLSYLFLKLTKRTRLLIELGWCDVISIITKNGQDTDITTRNLRHPQLNLRRYIHMVIMRNGIKKGTLREFKIRFSL